MMAKRILLLLMIAGGTFLVVFFVAKPNLLSEIWLWMIGLAGPIVLIIRNIVEFVRNNFLEKDEKPTKSSAPSE